MRCSSAKPRHPDEAAARRAAITAGKRSCISLTYYLCTECKGYHLTKSVGGENPRIMKTKSKGSPT